MKNRKIRLRKKNIIITLMVIAIFLAALTYAMLTSDAELVMEDQNVAMFVFNAENINEINLPVADLNPGDTEIYEFAVTNAEDFVRSEVTVDYQFTILTYHFIPFNIRMYHDNGEELEFVYECDDTFSRNEQNQIVCNSPIRRMVHTAGNMENYVLKVTFPREFDDVQFSGLVDFIRVEISSWQVQGS